MNERHELAKKLSSKEEQLSLIKELPAFKNDKERLEFVLNDKNWKVIYQSNKYKTRHSIFKLKHIQVIRIEVMVAIEKWQTKEIVHQWQNASTRRIFEDGTQSHDTYTDNYIVNVLKEERDKL